MTWTRQLFPFLVSHCFLVYRNHFNDLCRSFQPTTQNKSVTLIITPRFFRLRLQRYYKKSFQSKLFPNFFSSFFTTSPKPPISQHITPTKKLCSKTYFPPPHRPSFSTPAPLFRHNFNKSRIEIANQANFTLHFINTYYSGTSKLNKTSR